MLNDEMRTALAKEIAYLAIKFRDRQRAGARQSGRRRQGYKDCNELQIHNRRGQRARRRENSAVFQQPDSAVRLRKCRK